MSEHIFDSEPVFGCGASEVDGATIEELLAACEADALEGLDQPSLVRPGSGYVSIGRQSVRRRTCAVLCRA
jgi:hypothetical protein